MLSPKNLDLGDLSLRTAMAPLLSPLSTLHLHFSIDIYPQVLKDAKAVDEAFAAGQDIKPLCGLAFAVKDNIDVLGYPTAAGTPALEGSHRSNPSIPHNGCELLVMA